MKYFYYAVIESKNNLFFAYTQRIRENTNIIGMMTDDVIIIHPCKTEKESHMLADQWNSNFEANHTLMYK